MKTAELRGIREMVSAKPVKVKIMCRERFEDGARVADSLGLKSFSKGQFKDVEIKGDYYTIYTWRGALPATHYLLNYIHQSNGRCVFLDPKRRNLLAIDGDELVETVRNKNFLALYLDD